MMLDDDRTDLERPGQAGPDASPVPIVIVQRGASGWGREFLLLALLLSATVYIVYKEYRGPVFLDRGEPRLTSRMVDAIPVASVAEGEVVLRSDSTPGPESALPAGPTSGDRSLDGSQSVPEADPGPNLEIASGRETAADRAPSPKVDPETVVAAEAIPIPDADDGGIPEAAGQPQAGDALPDAGPARSEIVWDLGRQVEPEPGPVDGPGDGPLDLDGEPDQIRDRVAPRPREFRPPTLEQRQHFLQSLATAIRQEGLRAGPQIDGLCQDFGKGLPPELDAVGQRLGPNFVPSGWDVDRTVTALRRLGVPEPYLLDRLSEQMERTIGARHGPRNRMESKVFAARRLLSIPLASGEAGLAN
jgi:hypothetical protein